MLRSPLVYWNGLNVRYLCPRKLSISASHVYAENGHIDWNLAVIFPAQLLHSVFAFDWTLL